MTWTPVFDRDGRLAVDRRHRDRAVRSEHRLGRNRRTQQPPELVVGRRRLQVARRRRDLDPHGPARDPAHRPRRHPPANPDIVFVAALGHLWGPNAERGLYRTGTAARRGRSADDRRRHRRRSTWRSTADGRTLSPRRTSGGGAVGVSSAAARAAALYRSLDGGDTWEKLTTGLPRARVGRIGVEISRSHPNIVYAHRRAQDGGRRVPVRRPRHDLDAAELAQPTPELLQPDPHRSDRIPTRSGCSAASLCLSIDAGKTFRSERHGRPRPRRPPRAVDQPEQSRPLCSATTAACTSRYDGSRNWDFVDNLPIGQFYDIGVDNARSVLDLRRHAGQRHLGRFRAARPACSASPTPTSSTSPTATASTPSRDPSDSAHVYANSQSGRTYLVDLETREEQGIRPVPDGPEGDVPVQLEHADARVAARPEGRVLRRQQAVPDRRPRPAPGEDQPGPVAQPGLEEAAAHGPERSDDTLSRDDGVSDFGTITTIANRRARPGYLCRHRRRQRADDARRRQDVEQRHDAFKLPGARWVSRVLASRARRRARRTSRSTATRTTTSSRTSSRRPTSARRGRRSRRPARRHGRQRARRASAQPRAALRRHRVRAVRLASNGGGNWTLARGNLPRVRSTTS